MDDKDAIERCRAGDKEAFRHLVENYQSQAISHAVAILGSHEDAMDAVQDAFIDAFRAIHRIDLTRRFYPWFYIVLRNRCYKLAATRGNRDLSPDETEIVAPTATIRPEETMMLEEAMLELPAQDRELITLRHLDGLSYEELAARLEVPQGTIMSRLYHARKKLRNRLARRAFTGFSEDTRFSRG